MDWIDVLRRFTFQKYKQHLEKLQGFLGLNKSVVLTGGETDLAAFLYETDHKIEQLPFIYRRLFDFQREVEPFFCTEPAPFRQMQ